MKKTKANVKQSEIKRNLTYVTTQHGYTINDHFSDTSVTPTQLLTAVIAAAGLLFVTFFLQPLNFWLDITISLAVLVFLALSWSDIKIFQKDITLQNILLGLGGGVLLYLLCLGGNFVLGLIWPEIHNYTAALYETASSVPLWLAVILVFIVVPGEEIFWRGFIQRNLNAYFGNTTGTVAATAVYALVHIWAFNPLLILAALVGGACWGILYNRRNTLIVPILAHLLWCVLILAVFPLS